MYALYIILPDVLYTGAAWGRGGEVNELVNLGLGHLSGREGLQQLLEDIQFVNFNCRFE